MTITKQITLYTFDELEEDAKENARQWWREARDSSDLEGVVEDFGRVCELLGITLKQRSFRTMGGTTRYEPDVSWSVGYCQSDFAGFDGTYAYKPGAAKAIRAYAPEDTELHAIANALQVTQKAHFYHLRANVKYDSYYGQQVEVEDSRDSYRDIGDAEDAIKEALRDLTRWLYDQLRKEDEYQSADEQVDESIRINEYTFRDNGERED